jgi:hypothetical protein
MSTEQASGVPADIDERPQRPGAFAGVARRDDTAV